MLMVGGFSGGETSMPERTALAMHAVPFAFVGMGALMGGLYWIIGRRNELAGKSPEERPETPPEDGEKENGESEEAEK